MDAQKEFDALKTYLSYYRAANSQTTIFGPWRSAAYTYGPGGYMDTGYYRAVCNTSAVGALVKTVEPGNPNVDWERLRAMLHVVVDEYFVSPTGSAGWGTWEYAGPDSQSAGRVGQLHFTTGFVGYPCALAAGLMWNQLNGTEKSSVRNTLRHLASRLYQHRTTDYYSSKQTCYDSPTEEASGDAAFLALMSQFDRDYWPYSEQWRIRAQELMDWAFSHLNKVPGCAVPPNDVNQHYYNYDDTASNHGMYPHPNYGLSVLNDVARAVLPWAAQGIHIQDNPSGVNFITSLSANSGSGNHRLFGGGPDRFYTVHNANVHFIKGSSGGYAPLISESSDFTFAGRTYHALNTNQYADFASKSYLGVSGVSDWGFGADFQNGAFALAGWLDLTYYPSPGNGHDNYTRLLEHQRLDTGYGYLPTRHTSGCGSTPQTSMDGWSWDFLAASCGGGESRIGPLVPFFVDLPPLTLGYQVNTHFFLNSFSALNHLVGYLYSKSLAYWPMDQNGNSTLPNFND